MGQSRGVLQEAEAEMEFGGHVVYLGITSRKDKAEAGWGGVTGKEKPSERNAGQTPEKGNQRKRAGSGRASPGEAPSLDPTGESGASIAH